MQHQSYEYRDTCLIRVSGSLPPVIVMMESLKSLLAHDMRLSGTLPMPTETVHPNQLEVISLARNYLVGQTNSLEFFPDLTSVLLSSNYFSCDVPQLSNNSNLGEGYFLNPGTQVGTWNQLGPNSLIN